MKKSQKDIPRWDHHLFLTRRITLCTKRWFLMLAVLEPLLRGISIVKWELLAVKTLVPTAEVAERLVASAHVRFASKRTKRPIMLS